MFPLDGDTGNGPATDLEGVSGILTKDDPRAILAAAVLGDIGVDPVFLDS
jgi:hypothetical protein